MGTHPASTWGTPRLLYDGSRSVGGRKGGEKLEVPWDAFCRLGDRRADAGWQIFWKVGTDEAGIFKVDFIVRTPDSSPLFPDQAKVMQIFGAVCNHVEREPKFVSTGAGWRYGVVGLTAKKCTVQTLLLSPAPSCGCDPWLNPGASREVYEALREWLKSFDQVA